MTFSIELQREDDGRWLAEVPTLVGVMCYGADRDEAVARVQALALRSAVRNRLLGGALGASASLAPDGHEGE